MPVGTKLPTGTAMAAPAFLSGGRSTQTLTVCMGVFREELREAPAAAAGLLFLRLSRNLRKSQNVTHRMRRLDNPHPAGEQSSYSAPAPEPGAIFIRRGKVVSAAQAIQQSQNLTVIEPTIHGDAVGRAAMAGNERRGLEQAG